MIDCSTFKKLKDKSKSFVTAVKECFKNIATSNLYLISWIPFAFENSEIAPKV